MEWWADCSGQEVETWIQQSYVWPIHHLQSHCYSERKDRTVSAEVAREVQACPPEAEGKPVVFQHQAADG
jgi:hypothetical protein